LSLVNLVKIKLAQSAQLARYIIKAKNDHVTSLEG